MARTFKYSTTLEFGSDPYAADYGEVDVTVTFEVDFGTPEAGRFGPIEAYDPGSDDEIHTIRLVKVGERSAPFGMAHHSDAHFEALVVDKLEASEGDRERMLEIAHETEASDYDAARGSRWEELRDQRLWDAA